MKAGQSKMKQTFQASLGWMEKEHAENHREISAFTDQDHLNGNRERLNRNRQRTAEIDAARVLAGVGQNDSSAQSTSLAEKLLSSKKKSKEFDCSPQSTAINQVEIATIETVSPVVFDNHFVDSFVELSTSYAANPGSTSPTEKIQTESNTTFGGLGATLGRKAKKQSMSSFNSTQSGVQNALSHWFKNAQTVNQEVWNERIEIKLRPTDAREQINYASTLGIDETADTESFIEFSASEVEALVEEVQTSFEPEPQSSARIHATDTSSNASIRYLPSQRSARRLSASFSPMRKITKIESPLAEIVASSIIETTENAFSFAPGESICMTADDAMSNDFSTQPSRYNGLTTASGSFEAICVFDAEDPSKLSFVASEEMKMDLETLFSIDPLSSSDEISEIMNGDNSEFSSIAIIEEAGDDLEIPVIGGKPSRQRIKGTSRSRKTQSRRDKRSKKRVTESMAVSV